MLSEKWRIQRQTEEIKQENVDKTRRRHSAHTSCEQVTRFSSTSAKEANDHKQLTRAESSLRIVMFLSCWGPN
ncbi:hypothetical protein CDL12_29220 [Handroanthus impetiginosus]|uniref:Uncharacterized protein n=1 Tax=Handroanthus impetiginosus TaxID=429701 RepID=A0A2G9FZ33_9LAMI|nr:hypothetical protein CDL12_29220 [Handroanthus impetiginosus]